MTTWNYNPYRGWLDNKRYPDSTGPDYEYTVGGRLKTRTRARTDGNNARIKTTYTYGFSDGQPGNEHGDLVGVSYANDPQNTPALTYAYDRRGRQSTVTQNTITTILSYNNANQPLSESYSKNNQQDFSVISTYNNSLKRDSLSVAGIIGTYAVSYGYDAAGRLQAVNSGTLGAVYNYVANSPLVSQILFTNSGTTRMTTTKQYDYLNRLTSISSAIAPSAIGDSYAYNAANQRIRNTLADGSYWSYEYDSLGQVRSGHKYWADQTPVAGQQFEYTHDDIGNRIQTGAGGNEGGMNLRLAAYEANSLNQYTSRDIPPAIDIMGVSFTTNTVTVNYQDTYRKGEYFRAEIPVSNDSVPVLQLATTRATGQNDFAGSVFVPKTPEQFYYDADGNLANDGRWTYTWDAENRLVKLTPNTSVGPRNSMKFEYDWKGRRIHKQVWPSTDSSGTPTNDVKFVYDGWNLLAELNATNNAVIRSFLWGSDLSGTIQGAGGIGGLLFIRDLSSAIGYCAPAYDGNGNVAALASMSGGTNCATYEYGPFGEVLRATGPMVKANPFRFSTKYQDDETDLLYYGYRYYNPSTGRWISRDTIEESGGHNLYCFVANSAIYSIDPYGMCGSGGDDDVFCGKDVTSAVHKVLDDVNSTFDAWGQEADGLRKQRTACHQLISRTTAQGAWDIMEMRQLGASSLVGCARQATFQGRCHYGGAINYALFGRAMCNCSKAFPMDPRYRLEAVVAIVVRYKTHYARGGLRTAEAFEAIPFSMYGYNYGSPGTAPIQSIGNYCAPDMTPDTRVFQWHWSPYKSY